MKPLGLYLHIPFCKSKCAYCDFYSLPARSEDAMDAYTAALCRHLRSFADLSPISSVSSISSISSHTPHSPIPPSATQAGNGNQYTVDTVYFGGGTPSYLGARRLLAIWETVAQNYPLSDSPEVTLEANPDSCGDWLSDLRAAGFNRLSLGMQSADDRELREIGRIHTAAQTCQAVETARRAGFDNLSLDLIYGLPRQDMEIWQNSVRAAVRLEPEHLSCYGLKLEEGTPLYRRREQAPLPGDEEQAACYLWAVEELDRQGYRQYEISNFARPGRESRHNLKYWTLGQYAGFGPGAHSDFCGVRYAWARDLEGYCRGTGGVPLSEYTPISHAERVREWVMLGLRTAAGLDSGEYERRFRTGNTLADCKTENVSEEYVPGEVLAAVPPFDAFVPFLEQCRRAGYAVRLGNRWRLTPRGFLVSNQIIGRLLEESMAEIQFDF